VREDNATRFEFLDFESLGFEIKDETVLMG